MPTAAAVAAAVAAQRSGARWRLRVPRSTFGRLAVGLTHGADGPTSKLMSNATAAQLHRAPQSRTEEEGNPDGAGAAQVRGRMALPNLGNLKLAPTATAAAATATAATAATATAATAATAAAGKVGVAGIRTGRSIEERQGTSLG